MKNLFEKTKSIVKPTISAIIGIALFSNTAFAFSDAKAAYSDATTTITNPEIAFSDVPSTNKYYKQIEYLEEKGLLPSTDTTSLNSSDSKFQPDKEVTPLDFYSMLLQYAKTPIITDQSKIKLPYKDTNNSAWYSKYIQTAINLGILNPSSTNTNLGIDKKMKKREVIMQLFDTLGIGVNKLFDKKRFPFTDLSASGPFAPYAFKAYEIGIIESDKPTLARANKTITKAELANMLYQISQHSKSNTLTIKIDSASITPTKEIDNETFNIFLDVWRTIKDKYYYKSEIDETKMLYGAIKGAIGELKDPYTVFTTPDQTSSVSVLQSEYEGVGISVELIDNKITVISPFKDSPAEKAGIKPADIITAIDGISTEGMSIDKAVEMMKGKAGTDVTLTVKRDSQTLEIKITRGFIVNKTVTLEFLKHRNGYIAYINMVTFGENTLKEFLDAAKQISDKQKNDKNVLGILLDLRNNPGGYLDTAIDINGFFFTEDKTAVILQDNNGNEEVYQSKYQGKDKEYLTGSGLLAPFKVIILINKGSASSSEILAGSLQDYGKAKLVGEQSFGKGTVQELTQYKDNSVFKLTISKWLTPRKRDINKKGLVADIFVSNTGKDDTQLNTAINEF